MDKVTCSFSLRALSSVVAVLIIASCIVVTGIGVYSFESLEVHNSISTVDYSSFVKTSETVNSSLGLELALSLNATVVQSGHALNVSTAIFNTFPRVNNVSRESIWALPVLVHDSYSAFLALNGLTYYCTLAIILLQTFL